MEYVNGPTILQFVRTSRRLPASLNLMTRAPRRDPTRTSTRHHSPRSQARQCHGRGRPGGTTSSEGAGFRRCPAALSRDATDPSNETHSTLNGHFIGTPAYMSPEQMLQRRSRHAKRCFMLGAILYQLLADRLPIPTAGMSACRSGSAANRGKISQRPGRIGCVENFEEISRPYQHKALEKDPCRRYQSAAELCQTCSIIWPAR